MAQGTHPDWRQRQSSMGATMGKRDQARQSVNRAIGQASGQAASQASANAGRPGTPRLANNAPSMVTYAPQLSGPTAPAPAPGPQGPGIANSALSAAQGMPGMDSVDRAGGMAAGMFGGNGVPRTMSDPRTKSAEVSSLRKRYAALGGR